MGNKEITLDQVNELYEFLQGINPKEILMGKRNHPKMTDKKAFNIIWFLQEHLRITPDTIERCTFCGDLFDRGCSGHYNDEKYPGYFYCGACEYLAPKDSYN